MLPTRKQQIDIRNHEQFSSDQQERFTPKELNEQIRKLKSLQRKRDSSFRNAIEGSIGGSNGGNNSGGETFDRRQRLYLENSDKTPEEGEEDESSQIGAVVWTKVDEIIKRIKFKKYIKKLMFLSETRLWRLLTPRQGKIINDQSYYFFPKKSSTEKAPFSCACQTTLFRILTKFKRKFAKFPVFLPHRFFLESWQAMKLISFITCYFCYLVCFAFGISLEDTFNYFGLLSCQILLTVDILVTLNTGIYLKGVLCINRRKILENYKQSRALYYDLGSCISVIAYYIQHTSSSTTRWGLALLLPIMLKQNDINFLIKKVKDIFLLDKKMQNIIELVNLLKNILLISHVFACIWIYAAKTSSSLQFQEYLTTDGAEGGHTWISLANLQTESWGIQYLYSYYFITVTMLTVGYGDIRPVNPVETAVCIVLMMICCLIFGFTINQIGEIFQDFYSEETKIRQKRCVIGNYMKRKDISSKTKKSIYEYLEYYWKEQIDESMEEEKRIVNQLSDNLKELLFQESNKIILKQSRVFRDNFSPDLIMKCLPIIIEQNCTPGEILIDSSIGNTECSIFFVQQGELDVSHISTNASFPGIREDNVIRKISKGGSFGERQFFTGETSSMGVRSNGFSKLLKIKRSDFINIVRPIAAEYESFCMVKDRALFSNDVQPLYLNCSACNENSHDETYCPVTHFTARKHKIVGKGNISFPIKERNQLFKRERNGRNNALEDITVNFELLKVFMQFYSREIENHLETYTQFSSFDQGIPSYQSSSDEDDEDDYLNKDEEDMQQSKIKKKEYVFINTTNYNNKVTDPNMQNEQNNDNISESSIGKQLRTNTLNNINTSPSGNKNIPAIELNQQNLNNEENNDFKTAGAEDTDQKDDLPLVLLSAKSNQHRKQENSQNGSKEDLNLSKIKDDNSQLSIRRDSKIYNSPSRPQKNLINPHNNNTNQKGNLTKDVFKSIRTKVAGMIGNTHKPSLNQLVKKINASKHLTFQSPQTDKRLITSEEAQNLFLASIFKGMQNIKNSSSNTKKQFNNLQSMGNGMMSHRVGIIKPLSSTVIQPQNLSQGKTLAQSTSIWNSDMVLFDIFLGEFESLHNFKNYFPKYNLKNILLSKGLKDKTSKKENGQFSKNQRILDRRLGQRKNTLRAAFRNKGKGTMSVSSQRSPQPSYMECSIVLQQSKFKMQKDTIFKTEETKNKPSSRHPHSNKTIQISTQNINNNINENMTKSLENSNSRPYQMIDKTFELQDNNNIDDSNRFNQKNKNKIISEYNLNSSVRRILDNSISVDAQSIADVPEEMIIIRKDPSLSTFQQTCKHFKTAEIIYQHPSLADTRQNTGFDSHKQI